jgi:hypothetical protein
MSLTIMCGLFTIAFTFDVKQITWIWNDIKPLGYILGGLTLILGILWYKHQKLLKKARTD